MILKSGGSALSRREDEIECLNIFERLTKAVSEIYASVKTLAKLTPFLRSLSFFRLGIETDGGRLAMVSYFLIQNGRKCQISVNLQGETSKKILQRSASWSLRFSLEAHLTAADSS
jgi:hypothetical protein